MDAIKDLVANTHMDLVDLGTGSAATVEDLHHLYRNNISPFKHLKMINKLIESAFIKHLKN
jgi:hypothetical protein